MPEVLLQLLNGLQSKISSIQDGFDAYQNQCFDSRSSEFFCLELNGEAGELANLEKKTWKGKQIPVERFEDEAADVMIALFNYSNAKKIDLGKAVFEKLNKIEKNRIELLINGEKY
jgi:NTP pyrophosphatase (non-canonical NTP hydrolase)